MIMHVLSLNETLGSIPSITFCKEKLKKRKEGKKEKEKNNEERIFWGGNYGLCTTDLAMERSFLQ